MMLGSVVTAVGMGIAYKFKYQSIKISTLMSINSAPFRIDIGETYEANR